MTRAEPGTFPVAHGCYPSLFEFALDDSRRLASPERDFGLAWRAGRTTFRAAYVEHTGELYLVQLGPPADGGGHVRVLGRLAQERLDATLAGWQDECGEPESLLWLTGRFFGTSYLGPH